MSIFLNLYEKAISLKQLDLITVDVPQRVVFTSGIGVRRSRRALIVRWIDRDGHSGYGECSCRPDPFYSEEFLDAVLPLTERYLFPLVSEASSFWEVHQKMKKVRGWNFTKAALEFAAYDLIQKRDDELAFNHWPHWETVDEVPVGISIGIHETVEDLQAVIRTSKELGYRRLKFKISPHTRKQLFAAVASDLEGLYVSFDANGTFLAKDFDHLRFFVELGEMIEQPFPPGRIDLYQRVKKEIPEIYICQDEEVKSLGSLQKIHQLGCIEELNLKPGRVGGLVNSINILEYCQTQQIPCWIGGMFETGIGRSLNIQMAGLTPNARAHDQSPSTRYFVEDLVLEPLDMFKPGWIKVADAQGMQVNPVTLNKYTQSVRTLKND